MLDVKRYVGDLADGPQQTFLATKAVHGHQPLEHLVEAPPAPAGGGPRVIHARLGEIGGVTGQSVLHLRKHTDDHALAVQLQRGTQTEDQLRKSAKRSFRPTRGQRSLRERETTVSASCLLSLSRYFPCVTRGALSRHFSFRTQHKSQSVRREDEF